MFTGGKHKFKGDRHIFKDGKHKFKVGGHKNMEQKKNKARLITSRAFLLLITNHINLIRTKTLV